MLIKTLISQRYKVENSRPTPTDVYRLGRQVIIYWCFVQASFVLSKTRFINLKLSVFGVFTSLSRRYLFLVEKETTWLHQQVWIEVMLSNCDKKQVWFARLCRRPHLAWLSTSSRICRTTRSCVEFQARWILTKRSLPVFYFSAEELFYVQNLCSCLLLLTVGAWIME